MSSLSYEDELSVKQLKIDLERLTAKQTEISELIEQTKQQLKKYGEVV